MGRLVLVSRLAVRDLRRRPAEAALLLLAIATATTVLTLGLVLRGVIDKPYERTRAATAGPDTVATGEPADLSALAGARGVVAHSGPYPLAGMQMRAHGRTVVAQAEGRDSSTVRVDQPKPTAGGWVRRGGAVVEAAFAQALGIGVGDRITLRPMTAVPTDKGPVVRVGGTARSFVVAGVAVSAASPPYPQPICLVDLCLADVLPGGVWLTRADLQRLAPDARSIVQVMN